MALATFDVGASGARTEVLNWSPDAYAHNGYAVPLKPGRERPTEPTDVMGSGQATTA